MVEKISVQIALEGGDLIARQFGDIGAAGQKAFTDISKSAEQVGGFKNIKPEEVTAKLKEMGVTGIEAIDKIQRAVQQAGQLETLVRGITTAENALLAMAKAAPIVGVAVVAAMTAAAKATLAFAETVQKASAEAVKLGLNLEQFQKQQRGLEQLGLSMKSAAEGLMSLGKAADAAKLTAVTRAFTDLQEAATRGFGGIGTQQLKILEEAAKGVGPAADFARTKLVELGLAYQQVAVEFGKPFPEGAVRSLQNFIIQTGSAEAGMQAFLANLRQMAPGLDRTNLAIAGLGQTAGTEFIQGLRLAEGSMTPVEAKAEQLRQATERLSSEWGRFGSLTFSPAVVQGVDAATAALRGLDSVLTSMNWSAVGTAASVALNPLPNLIQLLGGAIVNLGSQFSGAGQAATQAGQQGAQGLQALTAAAGSAAQQMDQLGQKGAQAGQQAAAGLQLIANPLTGMPEVIRTTNEALAQTGTTGTTSFGQVGTAAQTTNTTLSTFASTLASWNWDPIAAGVRVWNDITTAIQGAIDKFLTYIGLKPSAPATGGGASGSFAGGGLLGGRGSGTSDSNLAWVSRGEHIMPANVVRQPGVLSFLETLRRGGGIPGFAEGGTVGDSTPNRVIGPIFNRVIQLLRDTDQAIFDTMTEFMQSVGRLDQSMVRIQDTIRRAADTLQQLNQAGGNARGGLLGGRGTGTSDSNLAWVSRGEYITPAAAVAQPGVLALLEALRRSGGNLRGVLDGMGRFALGGMVPRAMPAFANGGLAGGMSNVTIQFPGLPAIGGLRASSAVVDELHRAAALAQVRSGGRKPSRYS